MDKERLFKFLDRKYSSKSEIIPNLPLGEDADAIWAEILQSRRERCIELPLTNVNGDKYWYILTSKMISASEVIVDELLEQESTAELHKNSVSTIEEVYYTGFMEGAQISVQDAMEFLQSGGEPESVEELILLNSRQAAGFAAENMYHAIDSNYLHNLAYFLTDGLDNGGGDYRITDTLEIPSLQGETVQLPPAAMIPEQAERFAAFLADTATHPLIKAAAAQAWVLAYRPFPEGNERLARLLSSVILIRAGYGFFGNISISSVLARTSYDYFRAIANILRVENGADLTYFLEYYLVALSSAVNDMRARREQKEKETIEEEQRLAQEPLKPLEPEKETVNQSHTKDCERPETEKGSIKESLISVLTAQTQQTGEAVSLVDAKLLEYVNAGTYRFTSADIAKELNLPVIYVRNCILSLKRRGYIRSIDLKNNHALYEFAFAPSDPAQNLVAYLRELSTKKRTGVVPKFCKLMLKYLAEGKTEFSSADFTIPLGCHQTSANEYLRDLKTQGLLLQSRHEKTKKIYSVPVPPGGISIAAEPALLSSETTEKYDDSVLKLVRTLMDAKNAPRDNRIGQVIYQCLENGRITADDYAGIQETAKMVKDMRYARQLGLVQRSSDGVYEIMHSLEELPPQLAQHEKEFLALMFEVFGDDAFSADMVTAELDYSNTHACTLLHKLRLMRILNTAPAKGNKIAYQLTVNPTDNPELFGKPA